jgi:hypothetical protein
MADSGRARPSATGRFDENLADFTRHARGRVGFPGDPGLLGATCAGRQRRPGPKPGHVFVIVLENEGYDVTFRRKSPATYLKMLAGQGALLPNYYGIAR